tara:strand:+ start:184 stop:318 length:135 start_codon:yes stop_codon:yes gene_type:complete
MNRASFSSLISKGGKNMKYGSKKSMVAKKAKKNKKKTSGKKYGK